MRRVLIVAPHFAPVNAPDGHRARMLLPWLADCGWTATVLSVRPEHVAAPLEPALLGTIPPGIQIVRTEAWHRDRSRRFGVGNLGWRSLPWLWREGSRLLRHGGYDLVYFSTTQFATLPLGRWWRRRFGVPYVIDLQDPWHNVYYARVGAAPPPGGWKYCFASLSTRILEGWTLRRCRHVISVSASYVEDLQRRRPWFDPRRASVIPFGWSEHDQAAARQLDAPAKSATPTVLYFGRVGSDMARLLEMLLVVFAEWQAARPDRPRIEWRFVGTSYAGPGAARGTPSRLAAEHHLEGAVVEDPARMGYLAAIARQQAGDANLILGSDDHGYSPSKIWPTLASGRPWLAVVPEGSVLAQLLQAHEQSGLLLSASPQGLSPRQRARCHQFLDALSTGGVAPAAVSSVLRDFHADRLARRHAEIFDSIVAA